MVNLRSTLAALAAWIRQMSARLALRIVDRMETVGLTAAERAWLREDVDDDLRVQIDDAENRSISACGARTMLVTRSVADWVEEGGPLGEDGIDYLERCMLSVNRPNPSEDELFRRDTYLAAIGAAGGDVDKAWSSWREWEGRGDPEERRKMLAFQGRKIRAAMEEASLSIGEAARGSHIDTQILVAIMFGHQELRVEEMTGLTAGLGLDLRDLDVGVRFVPGGGVEGQGIYVIDPEFDAPERDVYPAAPFDGGAGHGEDR